MTKDPEPASTRSLFASPMSTIPHSHRHHRGLVVRIHSAITCFLLLNVTLAYAQQVARSTSDGVFTEEQVTAIERSNALKLIPRLAS